MTLLKLLTFPLAVSVAILALVGYIGGIIIGWPGAAWVVTRFFKGDEDPILCGNGYLSLFRLFSLFSVGTQSLISLADAIDHKTGYFPYTGPLFLLVFVMPILNGLWSFYSRKVDDYMGVE